LRRGVRRPHDEVLALAETLKAPVGHADRGKQFVEFEIPCEVGMTGLLGFGAAYEGVHECAVLLLLGTDFPYDPFLETRRKIAQVDVRAERLGRRTRLDLCLCDDMRDTLQALLPALAPRSDRIFLAPMPERHREAPETGRGAMTRRRGGSPTSSAGQQQEGSLELGLGLLGQCFHAGERAIAAHPLEFVADRRQLSGPHVRRGSPCNRDATMPVATG
jgi:thiamine pyrophosphate-dependent acetolactate synthase large subunit-like protein